MNILLIPLLLVGMVVVGFVIGFVLSVIGTMMLYLPGTVMAMLVSVLAIVMQSDWMPNSITTFLNTMRPFSDIGEGLAIAYSLMGSLLAFKMVDKNFFGAER